AHVAGGRKRAGVDGAIGVYPLKIVIQVVPAKGAFTVKRIRAEQLGSSISAEESDLPVARSNRGRWWRRSRTGCGLGCRRRLTPSAFQYFPYFKSVRTSKRMEIEKTTTTTGSVADVERIHPI